MLVCSCNFITDDEIIDAIRRLLDKDCWQLIVPAKVYHALSRRGRCCSCFPDVIDLIVRTTADYHAAQASSQAEIEAIIARLKTWDEEHGGRRNEGRRAPAA